jgi:hypothetical protein
MEDDNFSGLISPSDQCSYIRIEIVHGKNQMIFTVLYMKFTGRAHWITAQCHGEHVTSLNIRQVLQMIQEVAGHWQQQMTHWWFIINNPYEEDWDKACEKILCEGNILATSVFRILS